MFSTRKKWDKWAPPPPRRPLTSHTHNTSVHACKCRIIRKPTSTHTKKLYWREKKKTWSQCLKSNIYFFKTILSIKEWYLQVGFIEVICNWQIFTLFFFFFRKMNYNWSYRRLLSQGVLESVFVVLNCRITKFGSKRQSWQHFLTSAKNEKKKLSITYFLNKNT